LNENHAEVSDVANKKVLTELNKYPALKAEMLANPRNVAM
jgi:hypothetical protein